MENWKFWKKCKSEKMKKMEEIKITNKAFKDKLFSKFKLRKIYNYYGLVEQTGSIFFDCHECGNFITSIFMIYVIILLLYLN